jgi:hypothetical protein
MLVTWGGPGPGVRSEALAAGIQAGRSPAQDISAHTLPELAAGCTFQVYFYSASLLLFLLQIVPCLCCPPLLSHRLPGERELG